jgi:hypothetical protein
MPTVPRARRQVTQRNIENTRFNTQVSEEAFGGGSNVQAANALARTVVKAGQLVEQEKEKARRLEIANSDREFSKVYNNVLNNEEDGYRKLEGKQPLERKEEYIKRFVQQTDEIISRSGDDDLKERLEIMKTKYLKRLDGDMQSHSFRQIQEYDDQSTQANLETARDLALQHYDEPGKLGEAIEKQKVLIDDYAARNGLPPEAAKREKETAISKTHMSVMTRMLDNGQDLLAKDYLKEVKKELTGDDASNVERIMRAGTIRGESQRKTDEILGSFSSVGDAVKEARKIKDPDIRDQVVKRVKNRFNEAEMIKKKQNQETFNSIATELESTKSLDQVPLDTWTSLSMTQRQALERRQSQLIKGEEPATDIDTYYKLEQLAGDNRNAFKNANLMEFRDRLSNADFKKFSRMQSKLRGDSDEAQGLLDGIETKNSIVKNALGEMGIDHSRKASKEERKRANLFRRKVDEMVVQKQKEKGREVNNQELRQIVEDLRVDVTVDENFLWWDDTKKAFELTAEDSDVSISYDQIPERHRIKIEQEMRRNGFPVEEDQVVQTYTLFLNKRLGFSGNNSEVTER